MHNILTLLDHRRPETLLQVRRSERLRLGLLGPERSWKVLRVLVHLDQVGVVGVLLVLELLLLHRSLTRELLGLRRSEHHSWWTVQSGRSVGHQAPELLLRQGLNLDRRWGLLAGAAGGERDHLGLTEDLRWLWRLAHSAAQKF